MAGKSFSNEELNFFKFASIVLDEVPKLLRQLFVTMWDNRIASLPGYQAWDDSGTVRNLLLAREGGKTGIPTNKSINEWDCTALNKAIIYSITFANSHKKSLGEQYLKGKKLSGFHCSVVSASGNQDETLTLAIDQLRRLRNLICHISEPSMSKVDFDKHVQLAKDAFTAIGFSTVRIDDIGSLKADDFPTSKVNELNEQIKVDLRENNKALQENNQFLQQVAEGMTGMIRKLENVELAVADQTSNNGNYINLII